MSDREVIVTYAIRPGANNGRVFGDIAKQAADIQNAYTRAADTIARQMEASARRIETAYTSAARNASQSIAGALSQRVNVTASPFVMPMSPQQQAMARAQANGGTGVSQFLEDSPLFRRPPAPRAVDVVQRQARRVRGAEELADVEYVPGEPTRPMRRAIQVAEQSTGASGSRQGTFSTESQLVDDAQLARGRDRRLKEEERVQAGLTAAVSKGLAARVKEAEREASAVERIRRQQAAKEEREEERAFARAQQLSRRSAVEQQRARAEQQRAQNRRTIDILRQQEQEAAAAEQAQEEREHELAGTRRQFTRGVKKGFRSAVGVAEGIAYIGLSNEEDTQKLVQGIAKVRGAAMVLVESIEMIHGFTSALAAIRVITGGAALAEGALAVARGRAAVATGAAAAAEGAATVAGRAGLLARLGGLVGIGGGAAAAGTGGAAGAATGAGAAALGADAVIAGEGVLAGSAFAAILSALAAGGMATNALGMRDKTAGWMSSATRTVDDFGIKRQVSNIGDYGENRGWFEWLGRSRIFGSQQEEERATAAVNQSKQREAATDFRDRQRSIEQEYGTQITQIQRQQEFADLDRRLNRVGLSAGRGITDPAQRELAESQARRREFDREADKSRAELDRLRQQQSRYLATGLGEAVKPEAIVEAEKTRVEYLRRGLEIRRQEYEAQKRVNEEAIAGAQRAIGILQQRKGVYAQQAEALRQEYRTGAEAWGGMDSGQRAWAKSLKDRFDRGEDLGAEQERELMGMPISAQMRERIRKRQRERGEKEGYEAFAGGEISDRIAALDRTQAGIQRRIDVRQEVVVKIERDDRALLEKFRAEAMQIDDQIAGLVAADMNRSLEEFGRKIVDAMNQAFSKNGSQASAKVEAQAAQRGAAGAN